MQNSWKQAIKNILPLGLVGFIIRRRRELERSEGGKRDGSKLLRGGYISDLTNSEKWGLLAALRDLERNCDTVQYLEIGVLGGGTIKFLNEHTHKCHFSGIDLFEGWELGDEIQNTHISGTFRLEDVQKALGDSVKLLKGDSAQELRNLAKLNHKYDMIFIDANHTYDATKSDFENSIHLLKDGGYIAFHNCSVDMGPDNKYVYKDGGPWLVTQEIKKRVDFFLEIEIDRLRIFSYNTLT